MHLYNDNYSVLNGLATRPLEVQDAMLAGYGQNAGTMPLHTRAGYRILTWPNWNDEQASWEQPVRTYLGAFRSDDDVCLLLRFDPQTVLLPTEVIYQRIEDMLPEYGLTDDTMPELLLINDLLDNELQASLFNSVHAYLQCSGDVADSIQTARARETGLAIIPGGDSRTLRQAFERHVPSSTGGAVDAGSMTQLASSIATQLVDQGGIPVTPPGTWSNGGPAPEVGTNGTSSHGSPQDATDQITGPGTPSLGGKDAPLP